jgi:hypothetical protein
VIVTVLSESVSMQAVTLLCYFGPGMRLLMRE